MHGSAPDIAGQGHANPIACILSFAMALRYSFDAGDEAARLEAAVEQVLADGLRTADLLGPDGGTPVSTAAMGDAIVAALDTRALTGTWRATPGPPINNARGAAFASSPSASTRPTTWW